MKRKAILVLVLVALPSAIGAQSPSAASAADLRALAHSYYEWRDAAYPVSTSDAGNHQWDDRLADYRMRAVLQRRQHVNGLLARVKQFHLLGRVNHPEGCEI